MTAFRATYRLQLTPQFGFDAARALVPYLRDLGVSHLYLSPSLQARAGSTHGYDVVDPTAVSSELGGEGALRALAGAAHEEGLGLVLDVVPNHMAADEGNRLWTDPQLRERFFDLDPQTGRHRRFFDIDDLVGVRQEDQEVFEVTHTKVLSLVGEGVVDALRIDHPDGLADPAGYFARLRDVGVGTVWIEKILEASEKLRDWPVTGTVGYEFLNDVCAVFVDPAAEPAFDALWHEVSDDRASFHELALNAKREQAAGTFEPEIERLARLVGSSGAALVEAVASFPVYRSYVRPADGAVADADREVVAQASMPPELADMLLLRAPAPPEFVIRFQQTTPPVVAKGIEDTAFYRYGRLLALNDVGGDPGRFGIEVERFHAANTERARRFPQAMLTTMTHDTKRSSDVRARIAALTWIPDEWTAAVAAWRRATDELRSADGAPDELERYFLFQTLAGAWPIELERVQGYMEKALREAKRNTNWVQQNVTWEGSVRDFCAALYEHRPFLDAFEPFVARLAPLGERIALATVALKLTAPGVPDIYQGDELPLRALVDPDNRRPVDWGRQEAMLERLRDGSPPEGDMVKLWLTRSLLGLRRRRSEAFAAAGAYEPLDAGPGAVAFVRGGAVLVVVAVRRRVTGTLRRPPEGTWRDVLREREHDVRDGTPLDQLVDEHGLVVLERV